MPKTHLLYAFSIILYIINIPKHINFNDDDETEKIENWF